MLALIVEEAVEVLDSDVVKFAGLFNQQHVDPRYLLWLLAKAVDSDTLVPTNYVEGFIIHFFELWNLRAGRWGVNFRRAIFTFLAAYHEILSR